MLANTTILIRASVIVLTDDRMSISFHYLFLPQVHGKRFVYKFVCDLKMLLGYSAADLNRLVTVCAEKKLQRVRESLRPGVTERLGTKLITMAQQTVQTVE